jgi:hypothetical protein
MATALLDKSFSEEGVSKSVFKKLDYSAQNTVFQKAGDALCAMYKVHPSREVEEFSSEVGILDFVLNIGIEFSKSQLDTAFKIDLLGSFSVDESLSQGFYELIEDALITGAIVYLPNTNDGEIGFGNIQGKRFRLNYLLAPRCKFLPRIGKKMSITRLIQGMDISDNGNMQSELGI